MNDLELVQLAVNSLRHRSLRSWLAILGIVIGVASVISLISISVGLNESIQKNLGGLGANIITISAGDARAGRTFAGEGFGGPQGGGGLGEQGGTTTQQITFYEADALYRIPGVAKVDARLSKNVRVSYRDRNTSMTVIGTDPSAFPNSTGTIIAQGRTLGTGDLSSAVLGYSVQAETFNESMINKQIWINGTPFRVVGVLNQSGSTFSGPDRSIFISQRAAKKLFNQNENVSSVVVLAASGYNPDTVAANMTTLLQNLHHVTTATQDFTVTTASSLQSTLSSVTNTLALFLGAIASISLLVGGIGVANAMFTSVLEQTKYIALLKSLGSRRRMIMKLFVYEAGVMGLVGGVLGIALSFFGSAILETFGLPSKITLDLVLLGLGFSIVLGIISGLITARNAASVEPVEALRYE